MVTPEECGLYTEQETKLFLDAEARLDEVLKYFDWKTATTLTQPFGGSYTFKILEGLREIYSNDWDVEVKPNDRSYGGDKTYSLLMSPKRPIVTRLPGREKVVEKTQETKATLTSYRRDYEFEEQSG
jgi:hypothetical protein